MLKNLVFIVKASQDYIRYNGENAKLNEPELNALFDSVTETYIPLIKMFEGFEKDSIKAKIGLVIPPVLCTMMSAPEVQDLYIENLDKRITLGQKELQKYSSNTDSDSKKITVVINKQLSKYIETKNYFEEKIEKNLIKKISELQNKGFFEILATCGTDIFIPHYNDLPEIISAQIETGLNSYKRYFGELPEGFYLPELGYSNGVDKIIKSFGYSYTVVSDRSLLLAEEAPSKGIFYPCRTENTLAVFGADPDFNDKVFEDDGYLDCDVYRNEMRDIGFELSVEELEPVISKGSARFATGYKYYCKNYDDEPNVVYDETAALEKIDEDSDDFISDKKAVMDKAAECLSECDYICSVINIDASKFQKNWSEYILWLENVIRKAAASDLNITSCNTMIQKVYKFEKVNPYYSACAGAGYGENFLSSKNCWLMRYLRKSSERMIDLADRFPNDTGLKTRLLNLGAKELLIAQSTGIAKMFENDEFTEYADKRFRDSIASFTAVFDSLGSNTVSTEWLTNLEVDDNLFPWMNYRIFSKKI